MLPFSKKYKPKHLSEIVGQSRIIQTLKLKSPKPLLLHGPSGIGKTSAIHALANDLNAELIELNASDFRNKEHVERILKPASQQASLFGHNKLILIDEVDGLSGTKDRGAIPAIIGVIKISKFPIYLTANDPWSSKFSTLRKYCKLVQFDKISSIEITRFLEIICNKEDIRADKIALKQLAAKADGDLRAALNDLQIMSTSGEVTMDTLVSWGREQQENIFDVLKIIFKSSAIDAALTSYDNLVEDSEQLSYWLDQNISKEYAGIAQRDAYNCISRADIFRSRIMRRQHWGFLRYIGILLSAGVQQAKINQCRGFTKYQRPDILQKIFIRAAKMKKYQGIAIQIMPKLHASANVLQQQFLPYLNFIAENNQEMSAEINNWLEL